MTGVVILAAALTVYALVCLARPYHTCSRCHGTRVARNSQGRKRRCRSCNGMGTKTRPGARLVHSFYQHVKGEPGRVRRTERFTRSQVQAEHDRARESCDVPVRPAAVPERSPES